MLYLWREKVSTERGIRSTGWEVGGFSLKIGGQKRPLSQHWSKKLKEELQGDWIGCK